VAEANEFRANELNEMIAWADYLTSKYGTFNIRTDLPEGNKAGMNLPFIMNSDKDKLVRLVNEWGDKITYIIHQHINLNEQLFNATLRLCDDKLIGELNDIDKTSQRAAMLKATNLKRICTEGNNQLLIKIKNDLIKANTDAWFELTALKNNQVIYWQIIPEKINNHIKKLFSTNVTT
jgi:hypothetical protein